PEQRPTCTLPLPYTTLFRSTDIPNEELAQSLDNFLKEANKNYTVARSKALKGVKVKTISPDLFHEWNARNKKKGGQVKMEKVMNEEKFAQWEDFIKQQENA